MLAVERETPATAATAAARSAPGARSRAEPKLRRARAGCVFLRSRTQHYDGIFSVRVLLPRGTSERSDLSRVEWHLKALVTTPRDFCQKLRHRAAMLARRQVAVQTLLLCVGLKDDPLFLRAECDEAPALRALARLAKAGPDAVVLLVLEKAFGTPIDFRREMAVLLDA